MGGTRLGALKRRLKRVPIVRRARARWHSRRERSAARAFFENHRDLERSLHRKADRTIVLRARDGLRIAIRQNLWDARIVREIYLDRPYVRHVTLPENPIVVDVGGYIGDFSVYAARYLNAARVIVYEPVAENFSILERNVEINGYGDRITGVNQAVSDTSAVTLNVQVGAGEETHVSAYWYADAEQRQVRAVTLSELLEAHHLPRVDLLKIDCEGGEYDILLAAPGTTLDRVQNIVFEYHKVDGFEARLERVLGHLRASGYAVRVDGNIVCCVRT